MKTIASIPVTTVNCEVIPVLTPENYKDVLALFSERPIPDRFRDPDELNSDGLGRLELDSITNAAGEPTKWLVSIKDDKMWLTGQLPCSFPNCAGHADGELEETWAELSHKVAEVDLRTTVDLLKFDRHEALASLEVRPEGAIACFYMFIEREIPLANIGELADYFTLVSERLRSMAIPESE